MIGQGSAKLVSHWSILMGHLGLSGGGVMGWINSVHKRLSTESAYYGLNDHHLARASTLTTWHKLMIERHRPTFNEVARLLLMAPLNCSGELLPQNFVRPHSVR